MPSWWARWCLKSPASWVFTHPFLQAQIKENIKVLCHWHLWRHPWILLTKGQLREKCFHLIASSWKKTSKLRVTGFCEGNPPAAGGYPWNVSIWWLHHAELSSQWQYPSNITITISGCQRCRLLSVMTWPLTKVYYEVVHIVWRHYCHK